MAGVAARDGTELLHLFKRAGEADDQGHRATLTLRYWLAAYADGIADGWFGPGNANLAVTLAF